MASQILSGRANEVINEIHEKNQNYTKLAYSNEYAVFRLENKILAFFCHNQNAEPVDCARSLNLTLDQVTRSLKSMRIYNSDKRKEFLKWADSIAEFFSGAIIGNRDSFDKLEQQRKQATQLTFLRDRERIAAIMIYEKFPELNKLGDKDLLLHMGSVLAKNYFYRMYDALCHVYDFPLYKHKKNTEAGKISHDQAMKRIDELESELQRTTEMLGELQEEFNDQLQESKISEMTDFFAHLNSDRYGNILDQLLQVRTGMDKLKKEGYELPLEINGLFIMIRQLIQFTRDRHIEPIMKLHSKKEVCASDIEFCDYEGSPFKSDNERKIIEVISPGWVYKDQNVQISRPRVKECN